MTISNVRRRVILPDLETTAPRASVPSAPAPGAAGESTFDAPRRDPVCLKPSEGRRHGTNDDSIGRGRGTNDDSIGRGRGTNDDSIGGLNATTSRDLEAVGPSYSAAPANRLTVADLSATAKGQLEALRASPATAQAANYAIRSETFANLPLDQREKFIDVMAHADEVGVRLMAVTCEKAGDLFGERASDFSSMLDNLQRMANSPSARQFLNHTLADVLRPERIWQGNAPTCTVSTMQYELAKEKPAEYARLLTGLAVDGSVRLAVGGTLQTQVGSALLTSLLSKDQRSPTEAVFQSAAMEFANGTDHYDLNTQRSTAADGKQYRGLFGEQIRTMTGKLFGITYETTKISTNEEAAAALSTLNRSNAPNRPVLVDLVVDDTSNHCVAFEGFHDGRVFLRDPQTGKKSSISEQEFLDTAASVHVAPVAQPRRRVVLPE